MTDDYERHLKERRDQHYSSTRLWNEDPNALGMIGEKALTEYFGVPQNFDNRPEGDRGVDLQLNLRDYDWITLDAKASTRKDWLLVQKSKIKKKTIYVFVHATDIAKRIGICCGWRWGFTLMCTPARAWFRSDSISHRWEADKLRDMGELKDRMIDWRHQEVER